ncbi:unnamed protein product [Oikopleura dioica]|nr:unnamed protein product [Oikopleura dioica]
MKPIDEGNAQLAKEEERLRAMDAHIAELERGNEIGMARIEEFKSKFFAESARRSHLKTQFVQAGEEFKKINQKKVESEKLKAHYLRIEHHLQLEMAEIEELENELRRLSAQKQRSRNSSQRHSQRASVSSEKLAHRQVYAKNK